MDSSGSLKHISGTDPQRNVILFPGILGNLTGYSNVVSALKDRSRLYGIRYPLTISHEPKNSLQTLGARCAHQIARACDATSVHLLGWSVGGLVAFECAAALCARGTPAASLIMVDAPSAAATASNQPRPRRRDTKRAFEDEVWRRFLSLKCDAVTVQHLLGSLDFLSRSDREKVQLIEAHQKQWSTHILPPLGVRASFRFMRQTCLALQTYVPSHYPGSLHAICSEQHANSFSASWSAHWKGRMLMVRVPGDHLTVIFHFAIPFIVDIVLHSSSEDSVPSPCT